MILNEIDNSNDAWISVPFSFKVGISLDETVEREDLRELLQIVGCHTTIVRAFIFFVPLHIHEHVDLRE